MTNAVLISVLLLTNTVREDLHPSGKEKLVIYDVVKQVVVRVDEAQTNWFTNYVMIRAEQRCFEQEWREKPCPARALMPQLPTR